MCVCGVCGGYIACESLAATKRSLQVCNVDGRVCVHEHTMTIPPSHLDTQLETETSSQTTHHCPSPASPPTITTITITITTDHHHHHPPHSSPPSPSPLGHPGLHVRCRAQHPCSRQVSVRADQAGAVAVTLWGHAAAPRPMGARLETRGAGGCPPVVIDIGRQSL